MIRTRPDNRQQSSIGSIRASPWGLEPWASTPALARKPVRLGKLVALASALVLIGAGVAFGVARLLPVQYAARAELLYEISTEKPTGFLREDRSLTTQLVLMRSRGVLGPVAERAGIPIEDFEEQVTVSIVHSSEVIRVEVRAGTRKRAVRQTGAIIDRYLRLAPAGDVQPAETYLQDELSDVRKAQKQARAKAARQRAVGAEDLGDDLDAAPHAEIEIRVEQLAEREREVLAQLDEVRMAGRSASGPDLLTSPYTLADPVSPRPLFAAAAGGLAGTVIAACTIALIVRRRVHA